MKIKHFTYPTRGKEVQGINYGIRGSTLNIKMPTKEK